MVEKLEVNGGYYHRIKQKEIYVHVEQLQCYAIKSAFHYFFSILNLETLGFIDLKIFHLQ